MISDYIIKVSRNAYFCEDLLCLFVRESGQSRYWLYQLLERERERERARKYRD